MPHAALPSSPGRAALASRLLQAVDALPGARTARLAVRNYIFHQSGTQAGSVAFSALLAMFPLLILVSSAAAFVGKPGAAAGFAMRAVSYAPPAVAQVLEPVIHQVLAQRNRALLALGVVITVWTASSGTQAIRTALNRAYGVERGLSFWKARLKVIAFTVVGGIGTVLAFGSVIVLPYLMQAAQAVAGGQADSPWLRFGVRYAVAFVMVVALYAAMYGWLPDLRQRLRTVLPGAVVGALAWLGAAAMLAYTLRNLGKLALVYGSFAGIVATLVALYLNASTLIFGAEVNGVLLRREPRAPDGVGTAGD